MQQSSAAPSRPPTVPTLPVEKERTDELQEGKGVDMGADGNAADDSGASGGKRASGVLTARSDVVATQGASGGFRP